MNLDHTFFEQAPQDIVDLAETDTGVHGQLPLGGNWLTVKGIEDLEVFFGERHSLCRAFV